MKAPLRPQVPSRFAAIIGSLLLLCLPGGGAYWYTQTYASTPSPNSSGKHSALTLEQLAERLSTVAVIALARDVQANEKIEAKHLTHIRLPEKKVPRNAYQDPKLVLGKSAAKRLSAGHVLNNNDFATPETIVEDAIVPVGYSSLVVQLDQNIDRLSNWARSGTRVDLRGKIRTTSMTEGAVEQLSENAVVLSAPKATASNYSTGISGGVSIRLAVRSQDLQRVKDAAQKGRLRIFQRGSQVIL